MFKKPLVILTTAALLASASAEAVLAQPYGGRGASYGDGYTDGYRRGWEDFRMKRDYNDRAPQDRNYNYNYPASADPRMGDPGQRWRRQYQR
jgi:hypothetical protein